MGFRKHANVVLLMALLASATVSAADILDE